MLREVILDFICCPICMNKLELTKFLKSMMTKCCQVNCNALLGGLISHDCKTPVFCIHLFSFCQEDFLLHTSHLSQILSANRYTF